LDDPDEGRDQKLISEAQKEMRKAIAQFQKNYEKFASKTGLMLTADNPVRTATQEADKLSNIRESAHFFAKEIHSVLQFTEGKKKVSDAKWTGIASNFLSKFYPLARLSLRLTSAVADVRSLRFISTDVPGSHVSASKGSS
jgi:hypothetical protein